MAILNSPLQFITSIPPAARALTLVLIVLSAARAMLAQWYPENPFLLELLPGLVLWRPWTVVTAGFVEVGFVELGLSLIVTPVGLQYLERIWGAIETVKFVLVTLVVSNIIAVFLNVLEHLVIGSDGLFLFGMSYHGMMALQTGILVALTQQIPEHQVLLFGTFGVRVKRLPMLYVTFSNVMCIIGFQSPYLLIQLGWLVAWVYLRFYKRTGGDILGGTETWGDRSETFAFVHWFPPLLHGPVSALSNVAYTVCTRVGLVKAYPSEDFDYANGGYSALPGGARAEAERRRAMALKALDQRLAHQHHGSTASGSGGSVSGGPSTSNAAGGAAAGPASTSPGASPQTGAVGSSEAQVKGANGVGAGKGGDDGK